MLKISLVEPADLANVQYLSAISKAVCIQAGLVAHRGVGRPRVFFQIAFVST